MSIDVLPPSETAEAPPARSVLRLALSGLVVVLVLALVAGVTLAVRGLSGGGSQPEDALPGGAFAFAKVDLDPPAGQKLDALRFLRQFPALKDEVGLDSDLRETLFEQMAEAAGWAELDFDQDVAPWLGQRIGVAAYAPAGQSGGGEPGTDFDLAVPPVPTVVVAVQVTDADAARTGLRRLIEATPGAAPPSCSTRTSRTPSAPPVTHAVPYWARTRTCAPTSRRWGTAWRRPGWTPRLRVP